MSPEKIASALADSGWCLVRDYLSASETTALREECLDAHANGAFHAAGVGRGTAELHPEIRGDKIFWIDETNAGPALHKALEKLEALRLAINQHMLLGLFDIELHYAIYPPGAGYRRHLDRFRDDDRRVLTVILYLNENWTPADGGLLRFWPDDSDRTIQIAPAGGSLVTFLSERYWHEVTPAKRQRLSLTGWFRRR